MSQFLRIVGRQLAADIRTLPHATRRFGEAGRVARCRNIADLRELARRRVPRAVFDYVDGGSWDEITAGRNRSDFQRLTLEPRALVDVSEIDTATTVLGQRASIPIVGAPTGLTGLTHHRGEVAVAGALHAAGTIYTQSSASSYTIEQVAADAPGPKWFQLYVWKDRGFARELLERARAAGHLAVVVTVDVQRAGPRERDIRNGFAVPPRLTLRSAFDGLRKPRWSANFITRPRVVMGNVKSHAGRPDVVVMTSFINRQFDPSLSWRDLDWMREVWTGPIAIKGILRAEDARLAVEHGVGGVIVSNHGGRQLDGAPSAIAALPRVVEAVGQDAEVILDGGIQRGADVLKALALGARACMVGRALLYGLGAGGDAGARRAVEILADELRLAMALAGCPSLPSADASLVGPA